METIIATEGLTKSFRGKIVVNRLDLEVPKGSIFALLGDNGAGKSTTIRMLTGLIEPDAGTAAILGEDCWTRAVALRHRVGYVPEKPRFYDWMTVREIGWFTAGFHKPGFMHRYVGLIDQFRLDASARLRTLSKGGYAKVGLALALAPDPEVLILDEPTSGLDLFIRREFLASMVDLAGAGRTILISSHGIAEVERVASHVAFMAEGRLLLADSIEALRKRLVRVRLRYDNAAPTPAALGTVLEHEVSGRLWQAVLQDPDSVEMENLRCREDIFDLEEIPLNLEEMYTSLLARFHKPSQPRPSSNGEDHWDKPAEDRRDKPGSSLERGIASEGIYPRLRGEEAREEEVEPS